MVLLVQQVHEVLLVLTVQPVPLVPKVLLVLTVQPVPLVPKVLLVLTVQPVRPVLKALKAPRDRQVLIAQYQDRQDHKVRKESIVGI
jgi:hypothetical protein